MNEYASRFLIIFSIGISIGNESNKSISKSRLASKTGSFTIGRVLFVEEIPNWNPFFHFDKRKTLRQKEDSSKWVEDSSTKEEDSSNWVEDSS